MNEFKSESQSQSQGVNQMKEWDSKYEHGSSNVLNIQLLNSAEFADGRDCKCPLDLLHFDVEVIAGR